MQKRATKDTDVMDDPLGLCAEALSAAEEILLAARRAISERLLVDGLVSPQALDAEQFAAHGFAWLSTYVEGLKQMLDWAARLRQKGELGELESLLVQATFGEYLNQIAGGIAISQVEIVRPADMGLADGELKPLFEGAAARLRAGGNTAQTRSRIAELIADGDFGKLGLDDETLDAIRNQIRRFVDERGR